LIEAFQVSMQKSHFGFIERSCELVVEESGRISELYEC